jgi:hypothetical protein
VKIYVAAVEALRKKERWGSKLDETQFGTKNGAFLSFTSPGRQCTFLTGFLKISPGFGPNPGFWCRVFLTLGKTLIY